jgi:hypothetical protein
MSTDKTNSGAASGGAGGNAAAKSETTASSKAAARRKQQQLKNQKNVPSAKKKQQNTAAKSTFEGIASGVNPMKGIVIAQGNGNMSGQFRVFQKKLAGAAADDKAYGLDSAILDLTAKIRSDFVKPKPSPTLHSNVVPVMEADGRTPTGENRLVCHDPALKEQIDAEYNMDLKIQSSNWNQYTRHQDGYFRTAIGNVELEVLTYCRRDKRMASIEKDKDLVQFLLVLRSVCAQNNGAVKVDQEYQNLITLHSAVGFLQENTVSNSIFAEEVLDRYESAVFTCGKFSFGRSIYDQVLANYSTPMTFKEYMLLNDDDQSPIDDIVKDRTVARLIIKNSLNERLREQLVQTYSVNNNTCYPNTISEAVSLLSTFKKVTTNNGNNNNTNGNTVIKQDAMVSYHEINVPTSDTDLNHGDDDQTQSANVADDAVDREIDNTTRVSFEAKVMANIIAEAAAESDAHEQFIGASFSQQQNADDAYASDEPDIVCCAHIVDTVESDDVTILPNINYPDHMKDFELIMYHTAQRIKNKTDVYTINYDPTRPSLISYNYRDQTAESIIDYSDSLRVKFKLIGVNDRNDLMKEFENPTDSTIASSLNGRFTSANLKGVHTSTIAVLREETIRNMEHSQYNSIRYVQMTREIGFDVEMDSFPADVVLIHHVVSAVAIMQHRRRPNRWVNKITHKLIKADIISTSILESKLNLRCLNDHLSRHHLPRLHHITMIGFEQVLGMTDFRQGRF